MLPHFVTLSVNSHGDLHCINKIFVISCLLVSFICSVLCTHCTSISSSNHTVRNFFYPQKMVHPRDHVIQEKGSSPSVRGGAAELVGVVS